METKNKVGIVRDFHSGILTKNSKRLYYRDCIVDEGVITTFWYLFKGNCIVGL